MRALPAPPIVCFRLLAPALLLMAAACSTARPPAQVATPAEPPRLKIGEPYHVNGTWYHPKVQPAYQEEGIASWYGRKFHGRQTANGEIFDMNELTAAHPTLPLPSMVRVTNLENGRSLVLRVNDRGPFAKNRIIDVSRRGAQLLGFYRQGTARVRVTLIEDDRAPVVAVAPKPTTTEAERNALPAVPVGQVNSQPLPAPVATQAGPTALRQAMLVPGPRRAGHGTTAKQPAVVAARPTRIFVQAGAFSDYDRARRLGDRLRPVGHATITPVKVDGRDLYRVRLGPWTDLGDADTAMREIVERGIRDAIIVVD